jgi:hypothetical protein
MDSSIVLDIVEKSVLKQFRLTKIDAAILRQGSMAGGLIKSTSTAKLKVPVESDNQNILSEVLVEALGFSKGDDAAAAEPVFRISVVAQGYYSLGYALSDEAKRHNSLTIMLARPVYLAAVAQVHAVARQMDLHGVRLPIALESAIEQSSHDEAGQATTKDRSSHPPAKRVAKKRKA